MTKKGFTAVMICLGLCAWSHLGAQSKGGMWQFEATGSDEASWDAFPDSGEMCGGAIFSTGHGRSAGNACLWLDTDSVDAFFRVPGSSDLDFEDENIAVSAWICPLRVGDDVHYILNKGDQAPNPKTTNYALRLSKSGNLEFLIRDAANKAQTAASRFVVPEGEWTFIAVFYDYQAGTLFFWNEAAAPADTVAFNQSFFPNGDPLAVGGWYTSADGVPLSKPFYGGIDDVRIGTTVEQMLGSGTAVESGRDRLPAEPELFGNYPNPFNPVTTIAFRIGETTRVDLDILNMKGQRIQTLFCGVMPAGYHRFAWDGKERPSGIYLFRLRAGTFEKTRRMLLVR